MRHKNGIVWKAMHYILQFAIYYNLRPGFLNDLKLIIMNVIPFNDEAARND